MPSYSLLHRLTTMIEDRSRAVNNSGAMSFEVLRSTKLYRMHRREEEVWRQAEAAPPADDDLVRADEDIPDPGESRSGARGGA